MFCSSALGRAGVSSLCECLTSKHECVCVCVRERERERETETETDRQREGKIMGFKRTVFYKMCSFFKSSE